MRKGGEEIVVVPQMDYIRVSFQVLEMVLDVKLLRAAVEVQNRHRRFLHAQEEGVRIIVRFDRLQDKKESR